jgi:orotidine-5'-phosphate decarboxylase
MPASRRHSRRAAVDQAEATPVGSIAARDFSELAGRAWDASKYLCIGLDIDPAKLPRSFEVNDAASVLRFAATIVDATADVAGAYKPNAAFFEAFGTDGPRVLRDLIRHIHEVAPDVPVIIDAKRADISSSNLGSIEYLFEYLRGDATTVHPYLGSEAVRPFLDQSRKGIFVLCRTSNPGAGELQDLIVGGEPLFLHLATIVATTWNENGNCGLVVGATYPKELASVRSRATTLPLLIPGIGAQGGDLEATVRAAHNGHQLRAFINASRAVVYASAEPDFADAARLASVGLNTQVSAITKHLR